MESIDSMSSIIRPWHTLSATDAADALAVDAAAGLSLTDVGERLARHGENRLSEARPRPLWLKLLDQFRNFLVVVLVFAALLAWAIGDVEDAVVILVVVPVSYTHLDVYKRQTPTRTRCRCRASCCI